MSGPLEGRVALVTGVSRRAPQPADAARLVGWLVSDEAAWVTGQVIDSEGGFRRHGFPA